MINLCAVMRADRLNALADSADVVLLRDDEADDHLPEILSQNPDSASVGNRRLEIGVSGIDAGQKTAVIGVEIEIRFPDCLKIRLGAVHQNDAVFLAFIRG